MDCADVGVTEANPGMRFAYREFVTPGMLMLVLGIGSGLVILFSFFGPFGTRYTLNWNGRLAYCGVTGVLCLLICYPAVALTLFLARFRTATQIALALAVYALIMAVPCGAIAYGVYGIFHGAPLSGGELPATYLVCAGCILGSAALVHYVLYLRVSRNQLLAGRATTGSTKDAAPGTDRERTDGERTDRAAQAAPHGTAAPAAAAAEASSAPAQAGRVPTRAPDANTVPPTGETQPDGPAKPPAASFLERLPAHLGSDVVYLKVSGHYLEVVTTQGSSVILQRLMDAVRELGSRGMQVHRSYWVAYHHVRYVVRRDRRTLLHLTGDNEVPVSRTFLPEVRRRIKPKAPLRHRPARHPERRSGG